MEFDFQVVILATGKIQNKEFKLFMPIANKPIIAYSLEILERSRYEFPKGVLIVTRHECIRPLEKYLESYKTNKITNIECVSVTQDKWGGAEILNAIAHKVTHDVLVINEGIILEFTSMEPFIDRFNQSTAAMSMLFKETPSSSKYVYSITGDEVIEIHHKELPVHFSGNFLSQYENFELRSDLVDLKCYLFRKFVLELEDPQRIKKHLIPQLLEDENKVTYHVIDGDAFTVNNFDNYVKTNGACCIPFVIPKKLKNAAPQFLHPCLVATQNTPTNSISQYYHAGAALAMPQEMKQFNSDCIVGEGIGIGNKCRISKAVIGRNVSIGNNVKIENSVIMDDAVIEDQCIIGGSILCAGVTVPQGCKILGSMLSSGYVLPPKSLLKDNQINR